MADPRSMRRPRQIVIAAQSLALLGVVLQFVIHSWWVTLSVTVVAAVVVVAVVVSRPVAEPMLRWLIGLAAAGLPGALFSLWLIRDEEAAIPIGQVGGFLLSAGVTLATLVALVEQHRRSSTSTV